MRLFARVQGAPSGEAVVVPFDNKQKVEDVLKALCGRLSLSDRGVGDNTKESLVGFELRLASNNCLLVPSDLACTVLSDGDYVLVGENGCSCSVVDARLYIALYLGSQGARGGDIVLNTISMLNASFLYLHYTSYSLRSLSAADN